MMIVRVNEKNEKTQVKILVFGVSAFSVRVFGSWLIPSYSSTFRAFFNFEFFDFESFGLLLAL